MKIIYSEEEQIKREKISKTWYSMRYRCNDPNNKQYKDYGGRGIKVCDRWLDSKENFYNDMESTWFIGATIDRIDNDGNYELSNCQWLTRSENSSKESRELVEKGIHNFLGPETNNKRVRDGIHPFLGGEIQRKSNKDRVDNGTHHFLGPESNRKRIEAGTHNFLGGEISRETQRNRVVNGTHHFLGGINRGKICINNGIIEKKIFPENLLKFLDEGWNKGRVKIPRKLRGKYKKKIHY